MRDIIYVKLDIIYSVNHQLNETILRKSYFFETVKSKVIISLFETVRLSVSISPRNLCNSLKSIKERIEILACLYDGTGRSLAFTQASASASSFGLVKLIM